MYLEDGTNRLKRGRRELEGGVPGTVRGLGLAHAHLGQAPPGPSLSSPPPSLPRKASSFPRRSRSLNSQLQPRKKRDEPKAAAPCDIEAEPEPDRLGDFAESIKAYGKPDGTPSREGDRLVQPDLAATLERIAAEGPSEFYEGKTGHLIVDAMKRQGGLITLDDLAAYKPRNERRFTPHSEASTFTGWDPSPLAASSLPRCSTSSKRSTSKPMVPEVLERSTV